MKRKDLTLCQSCFRSDCRNCNNLVPFTKSELVYEVVTTAMQAISAVGSMAILVYICFVLN